MWRRAICSALLLASSTSGQSGPPGQQVLQGLDTEPRETLVPPLFRALDLGSIRPAGWLRDQLVLEADGLGGRLFDFYRFVRDSRYLGGRTEYSALHEASPYWFNGLVPLAFGLGDARVEGQVRRYLDHVLDHQQADGWLGFETTRQSRGLWARCLLLLGLVQYAEADPGQTDRIVDAMHRYAVLAHAMLRDNYTGLLPRDDDAFDAAGFGVARTHEMHIPLQWLYEKHPRGRARLLWETMELMIEGGVVWGADWRTFWVKGVFPEVLDDAADFHLSWVFTHGVNMAQGLRYPLAIYRMTRDAALAAQTRDALALLRAHHTSLAGSIVADEIISDRQPRRGAELCTAAELMFSLAWIYQQLGGNDVADWAEQVAFNALPASIAPDWWSHQYVQQENQPWARNLTADVSHLWTDVNSYANVFGLEPNYPCCTVNHPQAYPKFLAHAFVATEDGGLAHVFLVPGHVTTTLGGANRVSVSVDTQYPFAFHLRYAVSATSAFSLYVRIPGWAGPSSSIRHPGRQTLDALAPSAAGLQRVAIPGGGVTNLTFSVRLAPTLRVVPRGHGAVGLYYGPLLYGLAVEARVASGPPRFYRDSRQILPANTTTPRARDYALEPASPWALAIDPRQISVVQRGGGALPDPVWDLGGPPVELRVAAVEIEWPVEHDTAGPPPAAPRARAGARPFAARFVAYGSAKLHMAQLPTLDLDDVSLDGEVPVRGGDSL